MPDKVKLKIAFLSIILSITMLSCNNIQRSMFKADNGVVFDTIVLNNRYYLDDNLQNPSCQLSVKYTYPKSIRFFNEVQVNSILSNAMFGVNYDRLTEKEAVEKYWNNYVVNYKDEARLFGKNKQELNQYSPLINHEGEGVDTPDIFYSYSESLQNTIVYNHYGIMSIQIRILNSKGENSTFETYKNIVINLRTGKLISEEDIFATGYDVALRKLFQLSLFEKNNVSSIDDLEDLGYFGIDEIVPNNNFLITEKGIIYTFNQGEYSAFQLDAPEVFLSYDLIREYLKDNTVVLKISKL